MKRLLMILLVACLTAGGAYAIFLRSCPENKRFDCEVTWLSHKLSLTPEQTERVRAAHVAHCPSMNGLHKQWKSCGDPAQKADLRAACGESTKKLVDAVCAELTPAQREEYLKILEARKQRAKEPASTAK